MNLLQQTFALPLLLMVPFASSQKADAELAQAEVARQAYFAAIDDARAEVAADLEKQIQTAQSTGDAKLIQQLTAGKKEFIQKGTVPSSINEVALNHKFSLALLSLKRGFTDVIKEFVKEGKLEEAARLREELKTFEQAPLKLCIWGYADYKIQSGAGDWQPFANKVRAFTNRGYVWTDISPSCPFKQFTRITGGKKTAIQIKVSSPGWVFIAFSRGDKDDVDTYLAEQAWQPTPYTFAYNAGGGTTMQIFRKQLTVGEHEIPWFNFSGPILLKP
ncbi:hypothetical protein [Gimesia maris]|uniref:hypothetical protein n=1 Tax=Gimesia maris TaxID=122 RepID=UPI00241DD42E|nr:hypothetical protein [Gimesia maris]|tara:strand:+ start:51423 stop:52247 length:825 start_codon:yes stop_codon:yes gene_type:complete